MISMVRRTSRVHLTDSPTVLDEIWDRWAGADLTGDEAAETLQNCLRQLTERARLALRLRYADEASRAEIGEALGITEHGARNLMQRAKQQLRQCVENQLK